MAGIKDTTLATIDQFISRFGEDKLDYLLKEFIEQAGDQSKAFVKGLVVMHESEVDGG